MKEVVFSVFIGIDIGRFAVSNDLNISLVVHKELRLCHPRPCLDDLINQCGFTNAVWPEQKYQLLVLELCEIKCFKEENGTAERVWFDGDTLNDGNSSPFYWNRDVSHCFGVRQWITSRSS